MKMTKTTHRKAFILFPDTWLSYSPSIINLAKVMTENGWLVSVLAFDDGSYHRTDDIDVSYVEPSRLTRRLVGVLKLFSLYRFFALFVRVWKLRSERFDVVVGVDSLGYLIVRLLFPTPVYYSLHIRKSMSAYLCKKLGIGRIIIQTQERLELTFKDCAYTPGDVWFIQNSPILERERARIDTRRDRREFKMIYFGNVAKNGYGIENCIEVLRRLPSEVTLTLKGPVTPEYRAELESAYEEFIAAGRLSFDGKYIPQDEVISWLRNFDLGFCFYDEGQILRGDPNIISAPSGKLFNYLAAGMPVIGSRISGLKILSEFGAGILLAGQNPEEIGEAVNQIRNAYEAYHQGSLRAAAVSDFRVMAEGFLSELSLSENSPGEKNAHVR